MILTFASSKGGVGKSTTCACLAGAFAKAGENVHIIDLDNRLRLEADLEAVRPTRRRRADPSPPSDVS